MRMVIAWLNLLIPLIAGAGAYAIAVAQGFDAVCNPFLSGCTSVSRAARFGDAIFWFRGLMMPLSCLLVIYWLFQRRWLDQEFGKKLTHQIIFILGFISALALIIYVNFLGSDGEVYRFMRRFGVTVYFGFAMLAQLLSIYSLSHSKNPMPNSLQNLRRLQLLIVTIQWLLGLVSLAITIFQPDYRYQANNILEWNFSLAMTVFYGTSAWYWSQQKRSV